MPMTADIHERRHNGTDKWELKWESRIPHGITAASVDFVVRSTEGELKQAAATYSDKSRQGGVQKLWHQ